MQTSVSSLGKFLNAISPSNSALHEVKDKKSPFQETVQFHLHNSAYQISLPSPPFQQLTGLLLKLPFPNVVSQHSRSE